MSLETLRTSYYKLLDKLNDTSSDDRRTPNVPLLVLLILIAFVILIIGLTVFIFTRPNPYGDSVKLPELSQEIPDLTKDEQNLILANLYATLANNTDIDNPQNLKGQIRENSVTSSYNAATTIHSGSFIVDFPSEELSFQVAFEYAKEDYGKNFLSGYNVVVSCLTDPLKIIYHAQVCSNISPLDTELTPDTKLLVNLPYIGTTPSGETFRILPRHYSDGNRYYEVAINSCGNQDILNSALSCAKAWIKDSLELDPDQFTFETPAQYCPGGAH